MGLIQHLFKKEDTIESLVDDCEHKYNNFLSYITQAHYRSYAIFKVQLKNDMDYLFTKITQEQNLEIKMDLLKHLKSQLKFINKHPFSAEQKDMRVFIDIHYPYQEKINQIILEHCPPATSTKPNF